MSSEKMLIVLVVLFLIAEVIETVVDVNPKIKKHVQSVPFLNFVYQDAVGYVHIFEKTEMPNKDKLNGAVDNIIQDLQNHGYKVTDADRSLIEGAVEYAVNKMHIANQNNNAPQADQSGTGNVQTVEGMIDNEVHESVPDAPRLAQTVDEKHE